MPKRDRKGKGDAMKRLRAMALAALGVVTFGSVVMAGKKGGTRSVASAKDGTAASSQDAAAVSTNGTGNLSQERRKELVKKIAEIRRFLSKSSDTNAVRLVAFADELAKEVKAKKYGLVFEEHKEKIDVQLEHSLPMLTEDRDRFIDNGGELNFLIEGDNLAALKLLEKTHRGKIDLIYIDPPYNTGNKDFVYNDSFVGSDDTFRHSKWLSFMHLRLKLARSVLSRRGVIFISLNDVEQPACRLLCDEVFGEKNFCGQFIWHKKSGGGQTDDYFVTEHEYVLVYRKTDDFVWRDELIETGSAFNHEDERGTYKAVKLEKWGSSAHKEDRLTMWFPLKTPDGKKMYPIAPDGLPGRWRVGKKRMDKLEKENLIYWKKDGDRWVPYEKIYGEGTSFKKIKQRSILYEIEETGDASKMLTAIFGKKDMFSNPKPVELIEVLLEHCDADVVLDFFAGSGTTGHAAMKLNNGDGKHRKFILVTNNENGICEKVTYERLKRVIAKEKYAARLKYMKIDYLPIEERMYDRYAEDLLKHVRELVELENGLDFEHETGVAIVLTDGEAETLAKDKKRLAACRVIYKGHNVLLGAKTAAALEKSGVTIRPIPKYYYPELEY